MIKNFYKSLREQRIHLLVWAIFIIWEVVIVGLFAGVFGHPLTYILHYLLIISVFYLHALYALPWALKNSRSTFWRFPVVLLLELGGFILVSLVIDSWLNRNGFLKPGSFVTGNLQYTLRTLYRELYILGFATGYYYLATYLAERKKTSDLEKRHLKDIINRQLAEEETIKAQNAYLIAQINPHFFFNTLDYLYHNVLDVSPESAEAISTLASMMRFAIDADKVGEYIRLGDEIEQVENLIYLNQLKQPLAVRFQFDEEATEVRLIPLVLLTLAENVFKHGNLKNPGQEALISVFINEEFLHLETDNLINKGYAINRSQTGLNNIAKRLKNAYGEKVVFYYGEQDKGRFIVSLDIPLSVLNPFGAFSYPLADIGKE